MKAYNLQHGLTLCVVDLPAGASPIDGTKLTRRVNDLYTCRGNVVGRPFSFSPPNADLVGADQVGFLFEHFGQQPSPEQQLGIIRTFFVMFTETSLTYFDGVPGICNEWLTLANGDHWLFYGVHTNREYNRPGARGINRLRKELSAV